MHNTFRIFGLIILAQAAPFVFAQSAPADIIKIGDVQISGSLRTRVESWDWFQGNASNDYTFPGSIARVSLSESLSKLDWQLEFAAPFLLGLPNDAVASGAQGQQGFGASYYVANQKNTDAGMVFAKQGYLRFKSLGGRDSQWLKVGRMEFIDGAEVAPKDATLASLKRDRIAHRLIGNFAFSDVGRSFDGAEYSVSGRNLNLTMFGGRPTRGVFQVDGWGEVQANVYYAALTGQVGKAGNAGEWRLFGLGYQDLRDGVLKTDNRPTAIRSADTGHIAIGTYGGHYVHAAQTTAGTLDLLAWGVLQNGSWGALAQRAGAFAAEGGFQPNILPALKPWLRIGYDYGSGDKNASDGTHGTFFQVLPTPRIYARFPFFNMMNNKDRFAELMLRPSKKITIRSDAHALSLANRNDLWYSGGGVYQPWTFGYTGRPSNGASSLATLFDGSADFNINGHVSLGAYAGHVVGKSVIEAIYPKGKNANLGFLELTFRM